MVIRMINSEICGMLNIKYPVFQGGMAWVSDASLASAVSLAGGLGIIAAMNSNGELLRAEIKKLKEVTDAPFGVNIMLMSPFVDEAAQVVIEEKVPVVVTGAGDASRFMKKWIEAGIKVIPVVPSVALARMMERRGAVAVIAEGCESGGHVGELTTMTLVPQVRDAVNIPVIAAGGIADGRGMAAAMMLGACGVQIGTRFLVAEECTIHENYKNKVIAARDIDTIVTGKRLGHPVRTLKNGFSRELFEKEYDSSIQNEELEKMGSGALRRAAREGDVESGSLMCGQIAGLVKEKMTCREIVTSICSEAEEILKNAVCFVK